MFDDQLSEWMPIDNKIQKTLKHYNFREFCSKLPVPLVDTTKITDMINLSSQYLFEVVFETITRGFAFTPGKKTAKTIVVDKPFIAYAPKNFLKNLREDLGFQTFEDLWDESYDQLEGIQRQAAMMSLIQQIGALPKTQQLELYENSRKICAYNRKILRNL